MRSNILLEGLVSIAAISFAQIRPNLMEEAGKENLPSQQLGVDDLVAVSVYDAPELTRTVRVEADGTIHLPLLEERRRGGRHLSRPARSERRRRRLKDEQILVDPVGQGDRGGISQPSDRGDGRGEEAGDVSSRRRGDAARRAGACRGA